MNKKAYVNRSSQIILLFCISYGLGLTSFAAESDAGLARDQTTSQTTQLRLKNAQGFRNLQAASNLKLGSVVASEIKIDSNPTFRSNLNWLNHTTEPRVIGGQFTKPGKYTDVVGIMPAIPTSALPKSLCTGVLISKTAVLTAAHCVCDGVTKFVQFGSVISIYSKAIAVKSSTVHVGVDCAKYRTLSDVQQTKALKGRDVAVLELNEEVPPELGVPRRIADSAILSQWNQRSIRVVGFGLYSLDKDNSYGSKIHADVALVSAHCSGDDAAEFGCASGLELIAQSKDFSTDTCNGDSGGPAYIYDRISDHYYLVAITSRGLPNKPCGHGGIYELTSSQSVAKFLAQQTTIMVGRGQR